MDFDQFSKDYNQIQNKNIKITGESAECFSEYKIKVLVAAYKI